MRIRLLIIISAVAALATPAWRTHAGTLAWYRFGDEDTFGGGPVAGGVIDETVNSSGTFTKMIDDVGKPFYSQSLPGDTIYDPLSSTMLPNGWSLSAPGDSTSERVRSQSNGAIPSVFSFETFVRFDDLADAPTFAYHRSSGTNGWTLNLQSNDTIRASFYTGGTLVNTLTSTTAVTEGEWYHLGLIVTGNSTDGSDDAHLFVNYVNEASGNLTDGASLLSGSTPYYTGNVFGSLAVRVDESRYFDHALALDGSQFLLAVPEPSAGVLLAGALAGMAVAVRRRRRKRHRGQ